MPESVKVLIVDRDAALSQALGAALDAEGDIKVIGQLDAVKRAVDFMMQTPPDVVILDIGVPDAIDCIYAVQRFNAGYPDIPDVGVVLVARRAQRHADVTIHALEAGAFDFVTKPDSNNAAAVVGSVHRQLLVKLRSFSSKRIFSTFVCVKSSGSEPLDGALAMPPRPPADASRIQAILIGVSTGGPKALSLLLPALTFQIDLPILVVQHMPTSFTASLAQSLDAKCKHAVTEATDGEPVQPNTVYIAPGGRHMLVRTGTNKKRVLRITDDPPVDGCRPSVNMLFESAAKAWGGDVLAVVLTGMGTDGTLGLTKLKMAGAYTIAQNKETSVVWGMPGSAVKSGHVDDVLALEDIADRIRSVLQGAQ